MNNQTEELINRLDSDKCKCKDCNNWFSRSQNHHLSKQLCAKCYFTTYPSAYEKRNRRTNQ